MAEKAKTDWGKIGTILKVIFAVIVIALVIFWLVTGGPSAAWQAGKQFTNPIDIIFYNGTSTGTSIGLPWQPSFLTRGPDISGYVNEENRKLAEISKRDAADPQNQYSDSPPRAAQARTFGNPSPYVGQVVMNDSNAAEGDAAAEYVELSASGNNSAPIPITGWTLQSAVSGIRAEIPAGAATFVMGVVNGGESIFLAPGDSAVITTGPSPVGVSFRENLCTGYLGSFQTFTPDIANACPYPSDALPKTAENIRTYGASCFDYLASIPPCSLPNARARNDGSLTSACRSFVADAISYNGCVQMYHGRPSFTLPSWRVYLGSRAKLWDSRHDVIRLLDEQGRMVDVLTY